jgi:hypothetical protein
MTLHNPKKWDFPSEIQALLFPKDKWSTAASARRWAKQHGFKTPKTHITTNYIRIRQRDPSEFTEFRTIELGDSGVKAVVGEPKIARKRNKAWFGERTESPSKRKKKLPTDPVKRYKSSHWGEVSTKVYDINDKDIPEKLVKMGDLLEIKILRGPTISGFSSHCLLAFSPTIDERLYNILTLKTQKQARQLIESKKDWVTLSEAAEMAGGRQADFSYPPVKVQILGLAKHVVYHTHKKGDGPSDYIHELGEESGIRPLLCVSKDGRLWYAGGNYSVPDEGITD